MSMMRQRLLPLRLKEPRQNTYERNFRQSLNHRAAQWALSHCVNDNLQPLMLEFVPLALRLYLTSLRACYLPNVGPAYRDS